MQVVLLHGRTADHDDGIGPERVGALVLEDPAPPYPITGRPPLVEDDSTRNGLFRLYGAS